jgi:Zn-dependent protease with chaperone function
VIGSALPFLVAVAAGAGVVAASIRLRPRVAAVALTVTTLALVVATLSVSLLFSYALLAPSAWAAWCRRVLGWDAGPLAALGAVAAATVSWRSVLAWGRWRAVRVASAAAACGSAPLVVIDTDEPIAYARCGRHPQVVVSHGLLRRLDHRQRLCVLAHERAHLDGHHQLLTTATDVAAVLVPPLRVLHRATVAATERAADEAAAAIMGDRALVASTIAVASLARHDWLPAAGGGAVLDRCHALLQPRPPAPRRVVVLAAAGVCTAVAAALVQAHHFAEIGLHALH